MRTVKDVEAYLEKLNRAHTAVAGQEGTFLLHPGSDAMPPMVVRVDPPLVIVRVHVGDAPDGAPAGLFRKLLELNVRSLVHASYGLEGNRIVLSSALELENLDFNEIEATVDEIDLALAQQVPDLVRLAQSAGATTR